MTGILAALSPFHIVALVLICLGVLVFILLRKSRKKDSYGKLGAVPNDEVRAVLTAAIGAELGLAPDKFHIESIREVR